MKKLLLIIATFVCLSTQAQVVADPTIEQVSFTDIAGSAINDTMPIGYIAQLNIPIKNLDAINTIPGGSCKIKIGLGTKLVLDPAFIVSLASTSDYFDWSSSFIGGQVQITGELRADLPPNYSAVAKFNVMGSILDYSTITTNFLVTNHNSSVILSDENPSNNSSFRLYKIIPPIVTPVNFAGVYVFNDKCSIAVTFKAENEINVKYFEIESSKNGSSFTAMGTLEALHLINYSYRFPITSNTAVPLMYVRIKAVDKDGTYQYSDVKTASGLCGRNVSFLVYPNPIVNEDHITIKALSARPGTVYHATLFDATGRMVLSKQVVFSQAQQFALPIVKLSAGQYLLNLADSNGTVNEVLVLQKH